jgi:hypothetical protein
MGEAETLVAGAVLDRGVSEQRPRPFGRGPRRALERLAEPAARLGELDAP